MWPPLGGVTRPHEIIEYDKLKGLFSQGDECFHRCCNGRDTSAPSQVVALFCDAAAMTSTMTVEGSNLDRSHNYYQLGRVLSMCFANSQQKLSDLEEAVKCLRAALAALPSGHPELYLRQMLPRRRAQDAT